MTHQLLQEQTFPPRMLITRGCCFTRLWVCFSHKAHLVPVVIQTPVCRAFWVINHPSWQHFINVLTLTRPSCLRVSCELTARSTGSTLLFLALSECWLSALLFCLLSLHVYNVGNFFCTRPRPLAGRRTTPSPSGPVTSCSSAVEKCRDPTAGVTKCFLTVEWRMHELD